MDLTHVEDDLRAHLHGVPTPRAPGGLADAVRARHRSQRRQQAAVVGVGLAVALVFGSVPVLRGLVPDAPTTQDTAAPSSSPVRAPESLYDLPPRGPLATDADWLAAMAALPWQADELDPDTPAPVDTHRISWAGDVGGTRVAFVLGEAEAGLQGTWFTGPAAAAPREMVQVTGILRVARNQPLAFADVPDGAATGVLVVVGLPGDTAEYLAGTTVSADAQQQDVRQQLSGADGVAVGEISDPRDLANGSRVVVSRNGRTVDSTGSVSTDRANAVVQASDLRLDDPRDLAPQVSDEAVRAALSVVRSSYGSGLDGATAVLLAAGPTAAGGELVLVGHTFSSGATVLAAGATETVADGSATSSLWTLDPQPAGVPLADQAVAVLLDDDLALSGPSGAVTAEARDAGGAVLATLPLTSGSGTGGAGGEAATVRFLDAAGTALAEVPVSRSAG